MEVVSLVSGGKDSAYAAVLCNAAGHALVALATISADRERDSWMYQTVATDVVINVAQAMGLPLFRLTLPADLLPGPDPPMPQQQLDEVEVLYTLLYRVKQAHPSLGGVVSGAILSSYQRLRIELVCQRLGLVSL